MKLALLLLVVVCVVENVSGMSTCKTVDLEMVKKKRIEAIRSQILSKLRLPKEPEPDQAGDEEEIPSTLLSLYNSTTEVLKEQEAKDQTDIASEQEEEEYFAKVLNKFNMTNTATMKETSTVQMQFNISEIRKSVGDYRLLTSAELRMLIKNTMFDKPQRVELYEGNASYLASRFIDNQMKDKWLSFDVTATVQQWLQGDDVENRFELRLVCGCQSSSKDTVQSNKDKNFQFDIAGLTNGRGDLQFLMKQNIQGPYILTMSIPQNVTASPSTRTKRSTDPAKDTCAAQPDTCCMRSLYIDFRKDLGWKWIHKPQGYYANYCMGSCTYIWNTENKYAQILALYKHHNPGASAQPCCVPQALEPLPILYYVGRQHKVEQLSNMIVKSCKCS